jgi:5-methylcytosine-specific restriction endonuclease McrA
MAKWKKRKGNQKRWAKRHLLNKFGAICQVKENHEIATMGEVTLDHIIPKYLGGSDALENLQLACYRHNQEKGVMTQEEFDDFQCL